MRIGLRNSYAIRTTLLGLNTTKGNEPASELSFDLENSEYADEELCTQADKSILSGETVSKMPE